jgi:hypothetical protein
MRARGPFIAIIHGSYGHNILLLLICIASSFFFDIGGEDA